jgi:phosphoglycolate phosphatase
MEAKASQSFKAFVIDLDGTLLDTTKDIGLALSKTLNCTFTDSQIDSFVGRGLKNAVKAAVEELGRKDADLDELTRCLIDHYREVPVLHTRPYPGAVELLSQLNAKCLPICIYSNKEQDLTETILGLCFPNIRFTMIAGMHGKYESKPSSQAIEAFLAKTGVSKSEALYIGDSDVDFKTASNAGINYRILTSGTRSKKSLLEAGVPEDFLIDGLFEIKELV